MDRLDCCSPMSLDHHDSERLSPLNSGRRAGVGPRADRRAARRPADIDGAFAALARSPGSGASVMPSVFTARHRERIVAQAALHRIPTVYPLPHFVEAGGLMSYGIDYVEQFGRAASYIDRILKGTKPADLPVEQPVKFELTINRKAAAALALTIPLPLQVAADRVIE